MNFQVIYQVKTPERATSARGSRAVKFEFRRLKIVKKTLIAALASLMLAGALCAVDGATSATSTNPLVVTPDGCAPLIVSTLNVTENDDSSSNLN